MKKVKITLVRSTIKRPRDQKDTVFALGLRKMNQTVEKTLNPQIEGMIRKVSHLISVQEA